LQADKATRLQAKQQLKREAFAMQTEAHTKVIHIFVQIDKQKQVEVEFNTDHVTGAAIKEKAGVPADYELAIVRGNKRDVVADNQTIEIKDGEHFIAVPGGTVS
jgi:hypothetical protein